MSAHTGLTYRLLASADDRLPAFALFAAGRGTSAEPERDRADGFLLGAFEGGQLLGATASHQAADDANPPRVQQDRLCVTDLAVDAAAAGRGIGGGLMRLQRLLAVQQGLRLVTWDQDPLEGRLSHLAIHKLGAVSRGFKAALQGELEVEWWVSSPRVKSRLAGGRPELDLAHALEAGAPKLNAGQLDDDGLLRPIRGGAPPDGASALVEVPHDLQGLRARDPELALEWRADLMRILTGAFAQGYWLTDYLWLRGERVPRAYFLLIDGERTLG